MLLIINRVCVTQQGCNRPVNDMRYCVVTTALVKIILSKKFQIVQIHIILVNKQYVQDF